MSAIRELLSDKPVAYYPTLARAVGSVAGALFLQQISHWQGGKDRWVFRTQEELEKETALTAKAQAGARRHLVKLGLLAEEHKGLPRRLYYKVNWDNLELLLQSCQRESLDQPDGELCTSPKVDTTVESSNESKEPFSPRGAFAPEEAPPDSLPEEIDGKPTAAKDINTETIRMCERLNFFPSAGQKANWGSGWARYMYVEVGKPPEPEEVYAVQAKIVSAAAGNEGKTRFWLSVGDAIKRVRGQDQKGVSADLKFSLIPPEYESFTPSPVRTVVINEEGETVVNGMICGGIPLRPELAGRVERAS